VATQTDRAAAGPGPPVTWFGLVFEVVELGDRHGRVVLHDAIHAEQVPRPVDVVGDQRKASVGRDVPLISMRLCLPG
jgi:hypothetical protein